MKLSLPVVVRFLLGLIFTVFGLNGFLHFLPMPPMSGPAGDLMGAFGGSGYMFPMIFTAQLVGGVLLLVGAYSALALLILAPVIVNIVLFHLCLAPSGLPLAIAVLLAEIYLAYSYRAQYAPLFRR